MRASACRSRSRQATTATNGSANSSASNGRAKHPTPKARPAPASSQAERLRTPASRATAKLSPVASWNRYGRNVPPWKIVSGDSANTPAAIRATRRRSGATSRASRYTRPTVAAATAAAATRIDPAAHWPAASTAGHGGAYFMTTSPSRTPEAQGLKKSCWAAGNVRRPWPSTRASYTYIASSWLIE